MEYILWRLAEGLSSELVGDKTGLPWRPPASGDIWPALFTHERFPEKYNQNQEDDETNITELYIYTGHPLTGLVTMNEWTYTWTLRVSMLSV